MLQRVNMGVIPEKWSEYPSRDMLTVEWVSWIPLLVGDRGPGAVPADVLRRDRSAGPWPDVAVRRGLIDRDEPGIDDHALLPEQILACTILLVLVVDLFLPAKRKSLAMLVGFIGMMAALGGHVDADRRRARDVRRRLRRGQLRDPVQGVLLSVAILVMGISLRYFREGGFYQGEYYFLLLTSFLGCLMMPSSRDLLLLFISLELVSAPRFLMAAFRKGDLKSNGAGVKSS